MKKLALYLLASALVAIACTGGKAESEAAPIDTVPVMVMQIRKCSKLYTAEYKVRKIVTHDDEVELKGSLFQRKFNIAVPMSSRKIAIPVDAKLKAYVNFGGFSEKNVDIDGDKVEIILPDPKVELTSSRVDHDGIKKHVSLIRSDFTDAEMASYEKQGRGQIIKSIPRMGIIDMARAIELPFVVSPSRAQNAQIERVSSKELKERFGIDSESKKENKEPQKALDFSNSLVPPKK